MGCVGVIGLLFFCLMLVVGVGVVVIGVLVMRCSGSVDVSSSDVR